MSIVVADRSALLDPYAYARTPQRFPRGPQIVNAAHPFAPWLVGMAAVGVDIVLPACPQLEYFDRNVPLTRTNIGAVIDGIPCSSSSINLSSDNQFRLNRGTVIGLTYCISAPNAANQDIISYGYYTGTTDCEMVAIKTSSTTANWIQYYFNDAAYAGAAYSPTGVGSIQWFVLEWDTATPTSKGTIYDRYANTSGSGAMGEPTESGTWNNTGKDWAAKLTAASGRFMPSILMLFNARISASSVGGGPSSFREMLRNPYAILKPA